MAEKLLVTGAAGKLGRSVVSLLIDEFGVAPADIIATTRDTGKLADFAARGVTIRAADFDKPETLGPAFAGADRLLLVSTDSLGAPGHRLGQHKAAVSAAAQAGVKGIVYTSLPDPHAENHPLFFAGDHAGTERAIEASGLAYRFLRNTWYQENLFMSLPQAFAAGTWYTSSGEGRVAYVSHEDCARAAAAALVRPWTSSGEIYDITGPELMTPDEIAALASSIVGKPLAVVHLTPDQLAAGLASHQVPDFIVKLVLSGEATIKSGHLSAYSGDVKTLTGREPKPLRSFFEANKNAFGPA